MPKMRKSKKQEALNAEEFLGRVSHLGSDEILEAMETSLNTLCRYVIDYRREKLPVYLGEISMHSGAITLLAQELEKRQSNVIDTKVAPARQARQPWLR